MFFLAMRIHMPLPVCVSGEQQEVIFVGDSCQDFPVAGTDTCGSVVFIYGESDTKWSAPSLAPVPSHTLFSSSRSLGLILNTHTAQHSDLMLRFTTTMSMRSQPLLCVIPLSWTTYSMCSNLPSFVWTLITQLPAAGAIKLSLCREISLLTVAKQWQWWSYKITLPHHVLNISGSQAWGLLSIFSPRKLKCKCTENLKYSQCQLLQRYSNTKYIACLDMRKEEIWFLFPSAVISYPTTPFDRAGLS